MREEAAATVTAASAAEVPGPGTSANGTSTPRGMATRESCAVPGATGTMTSPMRSAATPAEASSRVSSVSRASPAPPSIHGGGAEASWTAPTTRQKSLVPSPRLSGVRGSVPYLRTSSPSLRPSRSVSHWRGSVRYTISSSQSVRPSPSVSGTAGSRRPKAVQRRASAAPPGGRAAESGAPSAKAKASPPPASAAPMSQLVTAERSAPGRGRMKYSKSPSGWRRHWRSALASSIRPSIRLFQVTVCRPPVPAADQSRPSGGRRPEGVCSTERTRLEAGSGKAGAAGASRPGRPSSRSMPDGAAHTAVTKRE